MKTKLFSASLAIAMDTGVALAQVAVSANANLGASAQTGSSSASGTVRAEVGASSTRGNATSTAKKNEKAASTGTTTASTTKNNASKTGEEHMSVGARFVQSLLAVANREGGIGAQVRAIAQAQNNTASTSVAAITNLETRSKWRTFFFGTDYKSVGQLRSDMTTTQANIDTLQKLLDKTVNASDRVELQAQIKALQDSQAKLEAFVKAHESTFSLFGWLNR